MSRSLLIAGGALALLGVATAQPAQCFERYQCIFHHDVNGQEYSWDLHQLCRGPGNEYMYNDGVGHNFSINVCGNTSTICSPGWPLYDTHGVAVQKWTSDPPCTTPTCTDYDTGAPICCTGQCAVLGIDFFQFSLVDNNNPTNGGVLLTHVGMPPDDLDQFPCPVNPTTNLPRERQVSLQLKCNQGGSSTSLNIEGVSEPTPCAYLVVANTKAACGVAGDPFDYSGPTRDSDGIRFVFVLVGVIITLLVGFLIQFGDARGWYDPVKRYLPALPGMGGGYKPSAGMGSSYKTISSATPISASAYGST